MTITQNALNTYKLLKATAKVAEESLEGRIQHYRAHIKSDEKELRTYTQKAAADLLGCNNRTLKLENGCDSCMDCGYSKCDK